MNQQSNYCKFCALVSTSTRTDFFQCQHCGTIFTFRGDNYAWIIYRFYDPERVFYSLITDIPGNMTSIFAYKDDKMLGLCYEIPYIFPETKPQDALQLARRLKQLWVFS